MRVYINIQALYIGFFPLFYMLTTPALYRPLNHIFKCVSNITFTPEQRKKIFIWNNPQTSAFTSFRLLSCGDNNSSLKATVGELVLN